MEVKRRVTGWAFQFGGVEHSGWLPPGAALPLPTPIESVLLDVEIVPNGPSDYLLCWHSQDGLHSGDSWFASLADAEQGALDWFGIQSTDWD